MERTEMKVVRRLPELKAKCPILSCVCSLGNTLLVEKQMHDVVTGTRTQSGMDLDEYINRLVDTLDASPSVQYPNAREVLNANKHKLFSMVSVYEVLKENHNESNSPNKCNRKLIGLDTRTSS